MRPIAPDALDGLVATHQHLVPRTKRLAVQRGCEVLIEIQHHLRDAALGWADARLLHSESELLTERGLHAVAVENLALDFRGLDRLLANQLDLKCLLIVRSNMLIGPDELARAQ